MGISEQAVIDQIKSELQKVLEGKFTDKPMNTLTLDNMTNVMNEWFYKALSDNDALELAKHVRYKVEGFDSGNLVFTPGNFFTGLLFQGIFYPAALHGATELATKHGKYMWDSAGNFGFAPNAAIERVFIEFTIKEDGSVSYGKGGSNE